MQELHLLVLSGAVLFAVVIGFFTQRFPIKTVVVIVILIFLRPKDNNGGWSIPFDTNFIPGCRPINISQSQFQAQSQAQSQAQNQPDRSPSSTQFFPSVPPVSTDKKAPRSRFAAVKIKSDASGIRVRLYDTIKHQWLEENTHRMKQEPFVGQLIEVDGVAAVYSHDIPK